MRRAAWWIPASIAVIARLTTREGFRKTGLTLSRPAYLLAALIPPLLWVIATGLVAFVSPVGVNSGIHVSGIAANIGQNVALNTVFLFGEEFGWRGYLQDKVVTLFGVIRGLSVMVVVWSFWHLPLDLMGLGYPNVHFLLAAFVLRPMALLGLGVLIGIVYDRSRSVWVACAVHAANNVSGAHLARFVDPSPGQATAVTVVVSALYCGLGLAALMVIRKRGSSRSTYPAPQPE